MSAQTPESKKAKQSQIEDSASSVVKKKTNKGKQTVHGTVKQGSQTGNSSSESDLKASLKKKNSESNTPGGSYKSKKKYSARKIITVLNKAFNFQICGKFYFSLKMCTL